MRTHRRHSAFHFNRFGVVAVALTAALATLSAEPAGAAFPGENGRVVFVSDRDGNNEIYSMNPNGSGVRRLTNHPANDNQPAVSLDGETIAFASNRTGDFEIYTMDTDGNDLRRVTNNPADQTNPAFSPDGQTIALVSDAGWGDDDIYLFDGTTATLLTPDPNDPSAPNDGEPAFSPDGQRFVFESRRDGNGEIYTMDDEGGNVQRLTFGASLDADPNWSPNGEQITFWSYRPNSEGDSVASIFVMNENGSGQQRLTNREGQTTTTDFGPAFSPDGTRIAFESLRDGNSEIHTMSPDGSGVTRLSNNPAVDRNADWGPLPPLAPCTITGHNGSEVLNGTAGADVICGLGGEDRIRGYGGDDEIRGGGGDDILYGGVGDDRVLGQDGNDIVNTTDMVQGNDLADGGQGSGDSCRTDLGDETVRCP